MQRLLDVSDQRDQVELDVDLPVLWRLSCGAVSGAVAQSGQYNNCSLSVTVLLTLFINSDIPP